MSEKFKATITDVQDLGANIRSYHLKAEDGSSFKGAEAGSHIDLVFGDFIRQYSLYEWEADGTGVKVAVQREAEGRGGSAYLADNFNANDVIEVSSPRNLFPLDTDGDGYVLIAGGIGVTPIYAMAKALVGLGKKVNIWYLCRNQERAVFNARFEALGAGDDYHLHLDDRDGFADLDAILAQTGETGKAYYCGPEGLLTVLLEKTESWPAGKFNFERFAAAEGAQDGPNNAFEVVINSTGKVVEVGEDQTILEALDDAGITVDSACADGICGTCLVGLLEGEADHRDSILDDDEKNAQDVLTVCVSRAMSKRLVLDL